MHFQKQRSMEQYHFAKWFQRGMNQVRWQKHAAHKKIPVCQLAGNFSHLHPFSRRFWSPMWRQMDFKRNTHLTRRRNKWNQCRFNCYLNCKTVFFNLLNLIQIQIPSSSFRVPSSTAEFRRVRNFKMASKLDDKLFLSFEWSNKIFT